MVDIGMVGDVDLFNGQGIENLNSGSPADGVGHIVVAGKEKDGDAAGGEAVNPSGKLSLLGLARLTALVGITAEEDKVCPVLKGIVYQLVKGGQEVFQSCRKAAGRVNVPVVFHSEVQVGKVDDFQPLPLCPPLVQEEVYFW